MSRSRGTFDMRNIKLLVLDEADNMLSEGQMGDQSIQVKNAVMRANSAIQIVLFSATFPDIVHTYAQRFAPQANEIRLKKEELSLDAIKQFFMGMPVV
jgi:ATP-dependent RNA helicase DDX19/DBP5